MRVLKYDIEHHSEYPWQFVSQQRTCNLILRTSEDVRKIAVYYGDPFDYSPDTDRTPQLSVALLECSAIFPQNRYYTVSIKMKTHKLRYHFLIELDNGNMVNLSESGVTTVCSEAQLRAFQVPYVYDNDVYTAPKWAEGFLWYQIFPDRFDTGREIGETNFIPTRNNLYGGTLHGIRRRLGYLKNLGIEGIYLNPIFSSNSNHRYDIIDYTKVDSRLGENNDLEKLVMEAHRVGLRIMLDGVFNHCGWDHPYWMDVCRNGRQSKYYDWFVIYNSDDLRNSSPDQFPETIMKDHPPYECFAFAANMPKWNTENPEVMDYLIGAAEYWTGNYHIDAWRLDVPDEVSPRFLRAFRDRIRTINPNIAIIGEIWTAGSRWISPALFDAVMNYPLYFLIRDYALLKVDNVKTFTKRLELYYASVPEPVRRQQWCFCGNHDVPRPTYYAKAGMADVEKAQILTAVFGGAFSIYYGDEIGMEGGPDPDNRRPMNWRLANSQTEPLCFYKKLLFLKKHILKAAILHEIRPVADNAILAVFGADQSILYAVVSDGEYKVDSVDSDKWVLLLGNAYRKSELWVVREIALFAAEVYE